MSYSYSRSLTLDHTLCGSSDSSNFPVLFTGTYSWLATVANSGHVQSSSGYDIVFASDSAGTSLLNFERVNYTAATGFCEFWIKVPTVSHASDTVIYVLYGDSSVTTDQQSATSVWDSNFKAVYHLQDTSHVADSTGSNNGTKVGIPASSAGKVNGGIGSSGVTSDYVDLGVMSNLFDGSNTVLTISGWIRSNDPTTVFKSRAVGVVAESGNTTIRLVFGTDGSANRIYLLFGSGSNLRSTESDSTTIVSGTFYHVSATMDLVTPSNSKIRVNGASVTMQPPGSAGTPPTVFSALTSHAVLLRGDTNVGFSGILDEMRFSNASRPDDWILTEYNNTSSPSTFYTVGSEGAPTSPGSVQSCFFVCM